MRDFSEWRRALEVLPEDEAEELRRLMRARLARQKQKAAPKVEDASSGEVPPPAPRKLDNRIYYVPSNPADRLGHFTNRSGHAHWEPKVYVDGV